MNLVQPVKGFMWLPLPLKNRLDCMKFFPLDWSFKLAQMSKDGFSDIDFQVNSESWLFIQCV